ncbi:hypothetical protein JS533_002890 [Bifidobacterium amazonense]|uniref:Uncharacterized protein n=1 Tax=Bifidobacterium amazonense TaxID=2809027 RepID=A0ABS9VTG3_9BIFI|nr:hypothetical protein [Bifidobacterium amazonense]MCH9275224.1 hypothetical protein [Bifidobacterium amazonense]
MADSVARNAQEQLTGAWIGLINQLRIGDFIDRLAAQDLNFRDAMASMDWAVAEIDKLVVTNRGGDRGVHGFIAEVAECGIENARSMLRGQSPICRWVNDNGAADLARDGVNIQVKFVQSGGRYSLNAVLDHLKKYPDFVDDSGIYQIPKDYYGTIRRLYGMTRPEAVRLVKGADGASYSDWEKIQEYFHSTGLRIDDLEPSDFSYAEVQRDAIDGAMKARKTVLADEDRRIRESAYRASRPSMAEGAKATVIGAAMEGATTFALAVRRRAMGRGGLRELTQDDWVAIAKESGLGLAKGGVRGAGVYGLNNFTATPAAVATALMTASFGVAEQIHEFRSGAVDEAEFIRRSEMICLDSAVSALSGFLGQALIPIPVLGALVGNAVGTLMYESAKDIANKHETAVLKRHAREAHEQDLRLAGEYRKYVERSDAAMMSYLRILGKTFTIDVSVAFAGSIELARSLGVPQEEILTDMRQVDDYFLG